MFGDKKHKRHGVLTKTVDPDWYKRYAKILDYDERVFIQPLRELREEKAMLEALESPPDGNDNIAIERSKKLAEAKGKKVQLVLQILDGNIHNVDVKSLRVSQDHTLLLKPGIEKQQQTLFWRARAVRPPGYLLSPDSKWRLFWDSPGFAGKMKELAAYDRSLKIKAKWIKALRTIQGVNTFTAVLADIAGATDETLKKINKNTTDDFISLFDKTYFRATSLGKKLDQSVIFTLSKGHDHRTKEEAERAASALRVIRAFGEFPLDLQNKICAVAWYLDVEEDKYIIREGHNAESFYFLLAGKAAYLKLSPDTGNLTVIKNLPVGSLIGEEAITNPGFREYTVRTTEKCKIIMVDVFDFQEICSKGEIEGLPPDHTIFLSQLTFMKFFPIQQLVNSNGGDIQLFYFGSGSVISDDIFKSQFVIIIFKGSAKVLAEVTPKCRAIKDVHLPPIHRSIRPSKVESKVQRLHDANSTTHRNKIGSIRPSKVESKVQRLHDANSTTHRNKIGSIRPSKVESKLQRQHDAKAMTHRSKIGFFRSSKVESKLQRQTLQIIPEKETHEELSTNISSEAVTLHLESARKKERGCEDPSKKNSLEPIYCEPLMRVTQTRESTCSNLSEESKDNIKRVSFFDPKETQRAQITHIINTRKLMEAAQHELVVLSKKTRVEIAEHNKTTWIHIRTLAEGDHVGLETLDLGDGVDQKPLRIALVSEGATVILMQKSFFVDNATDYVNMDLRANGPRFPGDVLLKKELERKNKWARFQSTFLSNLYKKDLTNDPTTRDWKYPLGFYSQSIV